MIPPLSPEDELQRQATLRSTRLLDSAPEERFDRVTRLARRLFDVPIALVSLVDAHRQWFKSKQGIAATETSREISFCGHAILSHEPFVVEDARQDGRFADNPLVTADPNIRFYAGHPLSAPDGSKLGTLCIISDVPRSLSADDLIVLRTLATIAESELTAPDSAIYDAPTGLANLRGFLEIGEYLVRLAKKRRHALHLILIRADPQPSPDCAQTGVAPAQLTFADVARGLLAGFADSDLLARCGVNDYAILLSDSSADRATSRFGHDLIMRRVSEAFRSVGPISFVAQEMQYNSSRHASLEALLLETERQLREQILGDQAHSVIGQRATQD